MVEPSQPEPAARMGRPPKGTPRTGDTLHVKLDASLLGRLDAETGRIAASLPGFSITRTATIRALLLEALAARDAARGG